MQDNDLVIMVKKNITYIAGTGKLIFRITNTNGTPDNVDDDTEKIRVIRATVLEGASDSPIEEPDIVRDWVVDASAKVAEAVASTRYLHIKYSISQPVSDDDLTDSPSAWIGLCHTNTPEDPTSYLDYRWTP